MKIGIVIPFYLNGKPNREEYRIVFRHYAKLGYLVHLCGSEGSLSKEFADEFISDTVKYFEVPQDKFCFLSAGDDHLRKKFNDSLKTLPKDLDWYCLAGADDIATEGFFYVLRDTPAHKVSMAGISEKKRDLFIKPLGSDAFKCKLNYNVQLLPGVNAFSRAAMDFCKWKPYNQKGCETGAEKYFRLHGEIIPVDIGSIIMVKSENCLNSVQKIKRVHKWYELSEQEKFYVNSYLG